MLAYYLLEIIRKKNLFISAFRSIIWVSNSDQRYSSSKFSKKKNKSHVTRNWNLEILSKNKSNEKSILIEFFYYTFTVSTCTAYANSLLLYSIIIAHMTNFLGCFSFCFIALIIGSMQFLHVHLSFSFYHFSSFFFNFIFI